MGFITINKRYLWYFSIRLLNAMNPYVTAEQHEEEESRRDSVSVASSYQITKALCLTENYNCDTPVC